MYEAIGYSFKLFLTKITDGCRFSRTYNRCWLSLVTECSGSNRKGIRSNDKAARPSMVRSQRRFTIQMRSLETSSAILL